MLRHTRSLFTCLALASVAACIQSIDTAPQPPAGGDPSGPSGGDDGSTNPPTSGSDTPTPPNTTAQVDMAQDFLSDLEQQICQAALDCISQDPDIAALIQQFFGDNMTACADLVANQNDADQTCDGIGAGLIDFDPNAAQMCLDDLKNMLTCAGLAGGFDLPDSCTMVFTGSADAGDDCDTDNDCASGTCSNSGSCQ